MVLFFGQGGKNYMLKTMILKGFIMIYFLKIFVISALEKVSKLYLMPEIMYEATIRKDGLILLLMKNL
jgi:hypothetical protein